MKKILLLLLSLLLASQAYGLTLKMGVIAPEGTSWAINLKKAVKEIKKATNGRVKFKVYFGGTQGDEPDVLRKIRVGHLQGGIFTGKTLGEINGDARVMEIPFTFMGDRQKAWNTLEKMDKFFSKGFEKKGFINLGMFEVGLIYLVSKNEIKSLEELKGVKIWAWEGDDVALSFIEYLNMIPIPLALTDVLTSLSTGVIKSAYAPPVGILAMQWHTKTKYIVDFPVTYSMGAFLVDKKKWDKIHPDDQKLVREICDRNLKLINEANINDNEVSIETLKSLGLKFVKFPKEDLNKVGKIREDIIKILTGKVFSKDALNRMENHLK
ncbi:MAG: TRAP transporter substrate-binding protein DctP [Bacteriovoracaceae bacterium]|nr:TRAP transporter substrate-binding protein DctP [Bacteriovoracaceae bacterium]